MSGKYRIRYLKSAENDMEEIFDYILRDSPSAAASMLDKFDKAISGLEHNPELGAIPKDERLKKLGYKMLIIDRYIVFYVIKNRTVQIRRVLHGARQYSYLL